MKLCVLVNNFRPPWAEGGKNNMREILSRWSERLEVFCIGLGDQDAVDHSQGYPVHIVRSPLYRTRFARLFYLVGYLRMVFLARSIIRAEKPDRILCYFETASTAFFGYLVKLFSGSRATLIHAVWSDWYEPTRAPLSAWITEHLPHLVMNSRWASWFALKFVDRILVSSEYLSQRVRSLGFPHVHLARTGVNVETYQPDPEPRKKYDEELVIGYLGHLSHAKGVSLLLEAVLPVLEELDARLLIATTEGGDEAAMFGEFDHPRVTLFEIVDQADFFNSCDLSILPRRRSSGTVSYPNVMLESMACGVPVLTSDLPAISEVVTDGENGFLFEANNAADLRAKLASLARDPASIAEAGESAREQVSRHYDWDLLAEITAQAAGLGETLALDLEPDVPAIRAKVGESVL